MAHCQLLVLVNIKMECLCGQGVSDSIWAVARGEYCLPVRGCGNRTKGYSTNDPSVVFSDISVVTKSLRHAVNLHILERNTN